MNENGVSTETNAYDMNGNRTSRKVGTNTRAATYDAKDRLIAQGGVNYIFDADGFLRSRGSDTFTYGTRGELLSANVGGVAVSYVYDTQVRLVARTQGSSKIEYLYGNLSEPFQLTAVKEAGVLKYNHYDPSGRLMAFDRGGVRYFVQTDQVGTPRVVTDAAGNVVKQIRTSAFGEVLADSAPTFKMYVGYAGGISDSQTGLVRFGFRDYEPLSGRWTARDPILFQGGQGNLYVYVGNSVVGARDPSGLQTLTIGGQCTFATPSGGGEIGAGLYFGRKADGTFDAGFYGSVGYAAGIGVGAGVAAGYSPNTTESLQGPSKGLTVGIGDLIGFGVSLEFGNKTGSVGFGVGLPGAAYGTQSQGATFSGVDAVSSGIEAFRGGIINSINTIYDAYGVPH